MPLRRVRFSLEQDEQRRPYLAMFSFNALSTEESDNEPAPQRLSGDVVGFRVRYYDREVDEWQEDWSDGTALPDQVEVTITYQVAGAETPIVQQCLTMLPARAAAEEQEGQKEAHSRASQRRDRRAQ